MIIIQLITKPTATIDIQIHHFKTTFHILNQPQPVPWKMKLEMVKEMKIKILNGGEILVN